jgi:phage tail tape-measure protein
MSSYAIPGLQVAAAGYTAPKLADWAVKDFNENLGHTLTGGLVGDQSTAKAIGSGATGAAAGALTGAAIGAAGGPIGAGVGAIIGGAIGAISSIFGW